MYFSFAAARSLGLPLALVLLAPPLAFKHDTLPDARLTFGGSASHLGGTESELLRYALFKNVLHALCDVDIILGTSLVVM